MPAFKMDLRVPLRPPGTVSAVEVREPCAPASAATTFSSSAKGWSRANSSLADDGRLTGVGVAAVCISYSCAATAGIASCTYDRRAAGVVRWSVSVTNGHNMAMSTGAAPPSAVSPTTGRSPSGSCPPDNDAPLRVELTFAQSRMFTRPSPSASRNSYEWRRSNKPSPRESNPLPRPCTPSSTSSSVS